MNTLSKRTICLVNIYPQDYPGGLEVFCRAFMSLGIGNVKLITASKYYFLNRIKFFSLLILYIKCLIVNKRNPGVLFVFNGLTCALSFFFKRSISIFHGTNAEIMSKGGVVGLKKLEYFIEVLPIEKFSIKYCSNPVFVSATCKDEFFRYYQNSNGVIIHNPILNDFEFKENPFEGYRKYTNILFFGRWEEQKGISHLLQIGSLLNSDNFKIHVISPSKIPFDKYSKIFNFLGSRQHKYIGDYLLHADIVVLPSLSEGFGYSILESVLLSKLVLTNFVGIAPELQERYKNIKLMHTVDEYLSEIKAYRVCRDSNQNQAYLKANIVNGYNLKVLEKYSALLNKI